MEVDKIDLGLDDIIKLNRKRNQSSRGDARGRGQQGRGRGSGRGRGGGSIRGTRIITNSSSLRGQRRGRGGSTTGTLRGGAAITAVRGRSRYNQVKKNGTTPLNQQSRDTTQTRGRGRGRSQRGQLAGRSQRGQIAGRSQRGQQVGQGFISLNRRREQAIESLQKAKQTLAQLTAKQQEQKQSRGLVINQRRGLQTSTNSLNKLSRSKTRGRGRGSAGRGGRGRGSVGRGGRGRGSVGRGSLSTFNNNLPLASVGSPRRGRSRGSGQGQQGLNRTFGGSLMSVSGVESQGNQQRRRWRQPKSQDSSLLTISVQNSPPTSPKRRKKLPRYDVGNSVDSDPELQAQIRNLKPAISTKYNFKKSVFSQASTSTSLSDRFGANSPTSADDNQQTDLLGRKVFF